MTRAAARILLSTVIVLASAACGAAPDARPAAGSTDAFQRLLAASRDLGPTPAEREVSLVLSLPDPSAAQRSAELDALSRPGSPTYGQYESMATFDSRYGPDPAQVDRIREVLAGFGLAVQWQRGDPWLSVVGPAQRMGAAFSVGVHDYVSPQGIAFYASPREPTPPPGLAGLVTGVGHLSNYLPRQPALPHGGLYSVPAGGLKPVDAQVAYDLKPLRDQGLDGQGETVVVWALGDAYVQDDLDTFARQFGLPPFQIERRGSGSNSVEGETEMDLEVIHALAPGARLVVYTDNPQSDAAFLALQERMASENPGALFNFSWGGCEALEGRETASAFMAAYDRVRASGGTIFAASGDTGAFECLTRDWGAPPTTATLGVSSPAALPNVTAVGGTRISVRQDGSWYNETVWENPPATAGTGGGLSTYFDMPDWQQGPGVRTAASNGKRQIPDVAADADPASGLATYLGGKWGQGGGTSQAAPIWAGMTAVLNQYLKSRGLHGVGFFNPALYALAGGSQPYPPFHDIVLGSNLAYVATPGYDLATGLGTPDAFNLARDLEQYERGGG